MAAAPPQPDVLGLEIRHRFVDAGGLRTHVAEAGRPDGAPIVLVHGWPQHWWLWRSVLGPLAGEHRLLCPDLRGLGWTEAPRGEIRKEQLATDLLALLDALGLDRVTFVGHDWGAFTGMLLALRAPERLDALVVLSIPHLWVRPRDPRAPLGMAHALPLSTLPAAVPYVADAALRLGRVRGSYTRAERKVYTDVLRDPDRQRASSSYYRTFLLREASQLLSGAYARQRLRVPTTLVAGDRDPVIRYADLGGANADDLVVERLSGLGHFLPEEAPGTTVAAIRSRTAATR
jgi:pimeloyl-ACP methyl ester carboxylesterase